DFSLANAPVGMQLDNGVISWTPGASQVGTHSVTLRASNAFGVDMQTFSLEVSAQVVESPPEPEPEPEPPAVNFLPLGSLPTEPYGGQDRAGVVAVEDGGVALRLEGNRARALPFDYVVTPDTRLAFAFSSNRQGEVHAIGLDNDLRLSAERTFQLYGTQTYGLQSYRNYPGGGVTRHYDIPLGEHYTGAMQYLFFLMDHDFGGSDGQSVFSQIRIYEAVDGEAPSITSSPVLAVVEGELWQYTPIASGDGPLDFSLANAPVGMQLDNGVISWTPGASQVGTHSVTLRASNAAGVDMQTFAIEVSAALVLPDYIDLNSYTFGAYGRDQDQEGTATVDPDGGTLRLRGNRLRQIPFEYEITPNTYLVFEFSSTRQGEVHAIGLDDNYFLSINRTFQLYGTQTYGQQAFNDYAGDGSVKEYHIPVGQYYTGTVEHLFFIMDHDIQNPYGESVFSKIRVYERN
ncbi:MAG: hypothetical protein HKO71_01335, partial [Pseudomonadales bacterium]|nr:hypothetical protein [Pseudomonadales bacterium]